MILRGVMSRLGFPNHADTLSRIGQNAALNHDRAGE
jgi:hypothetical protein